MTGNGTSQTVTTQSSTTPSGSHSRRVPRAAYIHVPFCAHRCGYCNFTLVAGRNDLVPAYLQAIQAELGSLNGQHEVDTLFLGGGTPTQLSAVQLRHLCDTVRHVFPLASGGEFSVEANPADFDEPKAEVLQDAGVTRISLGAQSFDVETLKCLERDHSPEQIDAAFELARKFASSVSLDLIFAAPGQSLDAWQAELHRALELRPDHVSTYGLTFERGTTFWSRLTKADLREVDEETQREMYLASIDVLSAAGLQHYEVSNFARTGHRCRHNEVYWGGDEYFAAGPGAARYIAGERSTNHRSTFTWLQRIQAGESPVAFRETLTPEDRAREQLVLGLRRVRGISLDEFEQTTGFSVVELLGEALNTWRQQELIEASPDNLRLTPSGLLVSDHLWGEVLRS